jgi:hypothetical protein
MRPLLVPECPVVCFGSCEIGKTTIFDGFPSYSMSQTPADASADDD